MAECTVTCNHEDVINITSNLPSITDFVFIVSHRESDESVPFATHKPR